MNIANYNKVVWFKLRNKTIEYNRLEHTTMKMTTIAKTSLALSILTTGAITVTTYDS
ncbi:hypothetical protein PD502_13790 [Staphylococcus aureus]